MIRFIDLTDEGEQVCAFLSTDDDCFLKNARNSHTFSMKDIEEHPHAVRLIVLMPEGFFEEEKPSMTMEEYEEACLFERTRRINMPPRR